MIQVANSYFMLLGKIELQDPEPWPQISEKPLGFMSEDRSGILCCVLCAAFPRYCRGGGNVTVWKY